MDGWPYGWGFAVIYYPIFRQARPDFVKEYLQLYFTMNRNNAVGLNVANNRTNDRRREVQIETF